MGEIKELQCPLLKGVCLKEDCALFYAGIYDKKGSCSIKSIPIIVESLESTSEELNNIKNKLGKIIEK